eukprot:XP_014069985.1 PREDICTED: kelch repeat and BTB domain-containing protein 3 isoform X2 [Salmo salar]
MDPRSEGSDPRSEGTDCVPNGIPYVPEHRSELCVSEAHSQQLLGMLRSFRERGLLFDFTITVQDQTFPCHRCVLAACSDFFRAMFELDMRECGDRMVTLGNQSPEAVRCFLDFCYSGEMVVTHENVDMLFQLASFLQVPVLFRACSDFLIGTLELSNCLMLLALAEGYGSASLLQQANEFVVQNFHDLSMTPDFLDMPLGVLEVCLGSDSLSVPSEEVAVRSSLRWTSHDLQTRQRLLPRLLALLRLHHVPTHTLQALARTENLLSGDQLCVSLVSDAVSRQTQLSGLLPDARPATTQSYIYIHKTEENGEIHHSFCYSLDTDQWRELPQGQGEGFSMTPDPSGSSLTSYAEKLFVTGGCRGNCCRTVRLHVAEPFHDATAEVWCYCPVTHTCTPAPDMGKPRTMHTAVTTLDRLYVLGGRTRGEREGAPSLMESTTTPWPKPGPPSVLCPLLSTTQKPVRAAASSTHWVRQWRYRTPSTLRWTVSCATTLFLTSGATWWQSLVSFSTPPWSRLCPSTTLYTSVTCLRIRCTVSVQRLVCGKGRGRSSVPGSTQAPWAWPTESTSWEETTHLMRSLTKSKCTTVGGASGRK